MANNEASTSGGRRKRVRSPLSKKDQQSKEKAIKPSKQATKDQSPEEKPFKPSKEVRKDAARKKAKNWAVDLPKKPLSTAEMNKRVAEAERRGPAWEPGFLVHCVQNGSWYVARVVFAEINPKAGVYYYYVHYKQYKITHNEWVHESRIEPLTADNLARAQKKHEEFLARKEEERREKIREKKALKAAQERAGRLSVSVAELEAIEARERAEREAKRAAEDEAKRVKREAKLAKREAKRAKREAERIRLLNAESEDEDSPAAAAAPSDLGSKRGKSGATKSPKKKAATPSKPSTSDNSKTKAKAKATKATELLPVYEVIKELDPSKIEVPSWVESHETFISRVDYKIDCPEQLRLIYINDAKLIHEDNQLLALPVHQEGTVRQILLDFLSSKLNTNQTTTSMYQNFCIQVYTWFDEKMSDNNWIVYEPEQEQVDAIRKHYKFYSNIYYTDKMKRYIKAYKAFHKRPNSRNDSTALGGLSGQAILNLPTPFSTPDYSPSYTHVEEIDGHAMDMTQIFGAHHLLRFFRRLGTWLETETTMEKKLLAKYLHCARLFLSFLNSNQRYFGGENAESRYIPAQDWKLEADKYGRRLESNRIWLHKVWHECEQREKAEEEARQQEAEQEAD